MFNMFKRLNVLSAIVIASILGLSYSSVHPTTGSGGYTGAPGDASCASSSCHSGSNPNLDGDITIEGLPSSLMTNQTYTITVRVTNPNGNAAKAGFQLLALTGSNSNAGSMSNNSSNTSIKLGGGKNYFGHQPAINFPASNEVVHTVQWTAPSNIGSIPEIKFYAIANIADGNGARTNDRIATDFLTIPITGSSTPLTVNFTGIMNPNCWNTNDGRATAVASGGSGTYSYMWSSGQTTATATNLPGGTSYVIVSDGQEVIQENIELNAPSEVMAVASSTNACQNQNNGAATVIANGGVGNYTYLWSNGATTSSIANLSAGVYSVTVKDGNQCSTIANTTVSISPNINITGTISPVTCNGSNDGFINANVSGGTPPLTYLWSNGQTTSSAVNLSAGVYGLVVTDAAGCTKSMSFTVTEPPALNANVTISSNVSCFGGSNGSATLNISGGSPGYTFTWSSGQSGSGNTFSANNLSAGNYAVSVYDFLDCETVVNFSISQPTAVETSGTSTNVSCHGLSNGSLQVSTSGGTFPYTYNWSNGATTSSITNLAPNNYTVVTTDANLCQSTETFSIMQPNPLDVQITLNTPISCSGGNNGSLKATSVGGNSGYTYSWSNGATTNILSNLIADMYKVTVIDNKGCVDSSSFDLGQPAPMVVSVISNSPATCSGTSDGSISIAASNATPPYSYKWINGQMGPTLSGVQSGNYLVTVTDGNNCTSLRVFTIENKAPFQINAGVVTNISCFGDSTGTASVIANPNHTYLWSTGATTSSVQKLPAGIVSVVATDTQGCKSDTLKIQINQSPRLEPRGVTLKDKLCEGESIGYIRIDTLVGGIGTPKFEWYTVDTTLTLDSLVEDTLTIGTHTLILTDDIGCAQEYPYQITKTPAINISKTVTSISCYGQEDGYIEAFVSGGYLGFETVWSNGSLTDSLYNLAKGTYILSVIDSLGCLKVDTSIIIEPTLLEELLTSTNETEAGKNDGTAKVTPTGGTSPYSITWINGENTFEIINLAPGTYPFTLTDANGCTSTGQAIIIGGGCNLGASVEIKHPTCEESTDGALNISLPKPIDNYKILLTLNGQISTLPLDRLGQGKYVIIIEDSLGCQAIFQNLVLAPKSPKMNLNSLVTTKPNNGFNNGSIEAKITGGTKPYTFNWTFNGTPLNKNSALITNLDAGTYGLQVIDSFGCSLIIDPFVLERLSKTIDGESSYAKIYPNPTSGSFSIAAPQKSEIVITNYSGKIIHQMSMTEKNMTVDADLWPSGFYFLKVRYKNSVSNLKLTIVR
jgi:hypothetical protein